MSKSFYIATYSNVDVYECFIDEVPLMRRVSDNWVNATQILKAAKFPKAHRTRILEKEVQNGVHEKIQGGYGRFQGTWIPIDIARPLAHRYGITDEMAPILSYVPDPNNPLERKPKTKPASQQPSDASDGIKKPRKVYNTKKRRAAAAAAALEGKPLDSSQITNDDISQNTSFTGLSDSRQYYQQLDPAEHSFQSQTSHYSQHQYIPGPTTQSHHLPHQASFTGHTYNQQVAPIINQHPVAPVYQFQGTNQVLPIQSSLPTYSYQQHKPRGSNDNWSQDDVSTQMDDALRDSDTSISSEHSFNIQSENKPGKAAYTEALIRFFSDESDVVPSELNHPPSDYDPNEPIDEEGHTPLHWASSMASTQLIGVLLKNGADPLAPNNNGLNCVSRSVFFNNSFQRRNFDVIINLMKNCIYTPDKKGRTPLHYICESNTFKSHISKYYLETILDRLRKENENLLKIVLNHKDINGDTASSLARKSKNLVLEDLLNTSGFIQSSEIEIQDTTINDYTESFHEDDTQNENIDQDIDDTNEQEDEQEQDQEQKLDPENDETPGESVKAPLVPHLPFNEVGPILSSMLNSLADAYDTELKSKEEESEHTQNVLEKLYQDIKSTEEQNNQLLSQLESGSTKDELEASIKDLDDIWEKKTQQLHKILERSQALSLAKLVLKEESSISAIDSELNQRDLACELTRLQMGRNKLINKIVNEFTFFNINTKMNNYRRLISISCGLKIENIDQLIDEIEADLLTTVPQKDD